MDYESAKQLLLKHGSGTTDAAGNVVVEESGFLLMLRPYEGLIEQNFHVVLQAAFVVGDHMHEQAYVDRELVNTFWDLCSTSRAWGLHPKGMLQRNGLITEADSNLLENWISVLEGLIKGIWNGCPPFRQVYRYAEYVTEHGAGTNASFFVPYMMRYLQDEDETLDPTAVAVALGHIGARAVVALPTLRMAADRVYADWCHNEAQAAISNAISQIEQAN